MKNFLPFCLSLIFVSCAQVKVDSDRKVASQEDVESSGEEPDVVYNKIKVEYMGDSKFADSLNGRSLKCNFDGVEFTVKVKKANEFYRYPEPQNAVSGTLELYYVLAEVFEKNRPKYVTYVRYIRKDSMFKNEYSILPAGNSSSYNCSLVSQGRRR
jgi:hypothetical protein